MAWSLALFGAGFQADTFFVAFRIPNILRRLVGEGAATAALVPVLTEYLTHRPRIETMEMVRALIGVGIGAVLILTAAGVVWTAPLVHLFAPGFSGTKLALTVTLARIMFLCLIGIGAFALAMGVLHALRHFAAPAFAPDSSRAGYDAHPGRSTSRLYCLAWGRVIVSAVVQATSEFL